jgi:hypothetical protein
MPTAQEEEIAHWIAKLVSTQFGVDPGPATERDGKDGSGLTNDFTYERVDPPLALEITRLRDDFETPSEAEQDRLARRLSGNRRPNGVVELEYRGSARDEVQV